MASICVHRAPRTPLDSTPGHIRSRDGLQEDHRPATYSPQSPVPHFPAIHLTRQSPFYGPPGHIGSRDDLQEEPRPATELPHTAVRARLVPGPTRSRNSSGTAIAILGACRAHRLARWHRFVSIERPEPLQASLQGISARAMICRKNPNLPRTAVSALFHAFLQFI